MGCPVQPRDTLHIKQIKNEGLLLSTGELCSAVWSGKKNPEKRETRAYLTDSLSCKPEANTAL